uniref:F-box protein n=1 Tax=Noccaea caerulescens TaxID=107243 RepID=A0A1J3HJ41_NOCCA
MGKRSRMREAIPEAIWVEIHARLPLRSIARFKTVCKRWKSAIESCYFRRLFVSLHRNSSSSWSLMFDRSFDYPITEAIGFHGCRRWDLPKIPSSYIVHFKPYPNLPASKIRSVASSNGLVLLEYVVDRSGHPHPDPPTYLIVCNPVLRQWVEIPPLRENSTWVRPIGLVTRAEEDGGVVSSFKVVMTCFMHRRGDKSVYVYSSETGLWTFKRLLLLNKPVFSPAKNHSGMLYRWKKDPYGTGPGVVLAHDFYGPEDDDQWRVIPLPLPYNEDVRRCLTTSRGDLIYMEVLSHVLKVWRLKDNNYSGGECWHLSREEINMASVGFDVDCFPLGANPFDSDIVYLWSLQHKSLVFGDLRSRKFIVHQESENPSSCEEGCCVVNTLGSKLYAQCYFDATSVLMLSQFVLPQWMGPVPRPPN